MSLAARAQMLIRKPIAEVFEAFVDPALTSQFWFTKGSGRLEPGAKVQWTWEMYADATANVTVKELVAPERLVVEWDSPGPRIEWTFTARTPDTTFVTVTNSGFRDDEVEGALNSTGGFNLLLGGAKIFLEHGLNPRFVADHA